ncbi:AraC family transcriptional regulator [Limnobacter thiooxidans]|uniref:AraC family transcriptional regulator ligand-binding domain-containing protein n=1 Tax=Limnobacter thiooxidans TaxID=131080 RepID=UPI00102DF3C1|nr:AraC family transcriptional regulator [Limnobacter thiooxidans]
MKHLLRSTALLGFREVSNHAGFNADQIADKFNLNLDLAERDNQFVLMEDFVKMLEYAARLKNIPDLGLQMSPYHDLSILGPLSLVISNLPTVGQAVVYAAEHIDVMSPTILIETYPDKTENTVSKSHTWISISIDLDKPAPHTQALDVCLGNLHRFLKILAGNHYQLAKVMVPHGSRSIAPVYEQFFEAPVFFEQDHAALLLANSTFEGRLDKPNTELSQIVDLHIQTHFRNIRGSFTARTAQVIRKVLGRASCNKSEVAKLLAIHPRTLQRHLLDENTNFDEIKTRILCQEALRYLTQSQIPMAQLASILGFSEQATLVRFCKRNFGKSPTEIRKNAESLDM